MAIPAHQGSTLQMEERHNQARVPAYLLGSKQRHKCSDGGSSHGCEFWGRGESGDRLDPTTVVDESGLPALTSCEILGRHYHLSEFRCRYIDWTLGPPAVLRTDSCTQGPLPAVLGDHMGC